MTTQEVSDMIFSIGIPHAYYQFSEATAKPPPFICFYYPNSVDLMADNINYAKINALTIELYTDSKDFELEKQVEDVLAAHELPYTREETYIDTERMYMVIYYTEVFIDNAE